MIDQVAMSQSRERGIVACLMAVMFIITVGYGVVLPILPFSIERLAEGRDAAAISRHTGLLTGTYALALFLFAPLCGRISDRLGRRPLIVIGLIGFALTLGLFGLVNHLSLLYLARFLNGAFAAAVTPAAYALVGDLTLSREQRAHRFALVNIAGTAGFLVGPMIGGLVLGAARVFAPGLATMSVPAPFLATSALALLSVPFVWYLLPVTVPKKNGAGAIKRREDQSTRRLRLLVIAFVTAGAVGTFEVGLSLRGMQTLRLDAYRIGMMFTECSLVMFVAQAIVFSPLVKPDATRWLLMPSIAGLAGGLIAVPFVTSYFALVVAVALIAASGGILSPIVAYWISLGANDSQGTDLGLQTSAASLGQALGSAMGGLLFGLAEPPGAPFVIPAAVVLASLIAAVGLPELLLRTIEPRVKNAGDASQSLEAARDDQRT